MKIDFEKGGGLVPAIVQDAGTGSVLMLGFMNQEALDITVKTGRVTFYSRSKKRLWTKGEVSGNSITVDSIVEDCDGDTLLVLGRPSGPTCHTGMATCFGDKRSFGQPSVFLDELAAVIHQRRSSASGSSYTKYMLDKGYKRIAQKVGEEAVELVIEAAGGDPERMIDEAADLVYHLMVLLESKNLVFADVVRELQSRHADDGGRNQ